jgi:hypothetical protein
MGMLEAKREAVALEPQELVELEQIITDHDHEAAYDFLKERIYKRIGSAQHNRLHSHLDGGSDPAGGFVNRDK